MAATGGWARSIGAGRRSVRPSAEAVDVLLAGALLIAMVAERLGTAAELGMPVPVALALSVLVAGAVLVRRRAPVAAYVVSTAALSVEAAFVSPSPVSPYANLIVLYAVGLYSTRRWALAGPLLLPVGIASYYAGRDVPPAEPIGVLVVWLAAWGLGYGSARRQEEREVSRRLLRHKVVAGERARIAREVHDLVGHTLNVMLIQAGAARRVLDLDAGQTRELLTSLEQTGREALDELDRMLGLLRRSGPAAVSAEPTEPDREMADVPAGGPALQPGLADLARLTQRLAQAGIRITVDLDPATRLVPRTVDVSAYRIVQEALTNTVKHGLAESADVTVRHDGLTLDIEVCDDGLGALEGYAPGRGLLGIRERVTAFGGSLEHGGGERGGFRLHAVLPIPT